MKKIVALCVAVALWISAICPALSAAAAYELPEDVTVSAKSAMLLYLGSDASKDAVLFEREADVRRPPASTVRMMVGLYAVKLIREKNMDIDTATGEYDITCYNQITGTGLGVVGMVTGDVWTLRDLLTASMAETAADACVALCRALSGSVEEFVKGMNALAAELGCADTSFANVTGLHDPAQYTTARDLTVITRAAMEYPELTNMLGMSSYSVTPIKGRPQTRASVNSMLRPVTDSYYSALEFGRTGYTDEAGRCMVSVAKDGGYRYMAVVLGSAKEDGTDWPVAHFSDCRTLFNWAFNKFSYKVLLSEGQPVAQLGVDLAWSTDTVMLVTAAPFGTVVPNDLDVATIIQKPVLTTQSAVDAPVKKGDSYGVVELYVNLDQKLGEVPLLAAESVKRSGVLTVWRGVVNLFTSVWLYVAIVLFLLLVVGYAVLSVVHNRRRRRRHRRR